MKLCSGQRDVEFYADSLLPHKNVVIQSAVVNEKRRLEVVINGEKLQYPGVWVRQNCHCPECFNPVTQSYISSLKKVAYENLKLKSAEVSETGDSVRCEHTDGHITEFDALWLYNRRMTKDGAKERHATLKISTPVSWPNPSDMVVKRISYKEVTETYEGFETFGKSIIEDGIVIITEAPEGQVFKDFIQKTGLTRTANHYGEFWYVKSEPNPTNFAYTTSELDFHIDQPYLYNDLNIQVLHFLNQVTVGGENIMSDAVKAANILKERNPEYYHALTTTEFVYEDLVAHETHSPQFFLTKSTPVINLDENGQPKAIKWSHSCRSSFFNGLPEQYELLMKAAQEYHKILYEFAIEIKNQPGDMMVFDNRRLVHGRKAFGSDEPRLIEGWYFDWDMLYSYLRVAMMKRKKVEP